MAIKLKRDKARIEITGTDAVKLSKLLSNKDKALKLEYAKGVVTNGEPMLWITIVDNDQPK